MIKQHNFEAETWRILELLTHSIYSNKEIFLRELVSNASDAIDKARLHSITDTNFLKEWEKFEIKIDLDKEKWTITITDNGIWMTEEELHKNLWTIAKSWTKEFIEKLKLAKEESNHNLIWQFWVWFYSSFMVCDKVEVDSKSNNSESWFTWSSDWKSTYEVIPSLKKTRWTKITLFVNEANKELLEDWKIRSLIKKYSNYIWVPIMMKPYKSEEEKTENLDYEQVNETTAIWKKAKKDVKEEEYKDFYKSISNYFNEPLLHIHTSVEWTVSYKSLLFIPKEKNMFHDLSDPSKDFGPKLYVQNVLILENAKELLPVWLRFVSWVVETSDLPLNISREMLQTNRVLEKIKKALVKKVISELKNFMEKDLESYKKFFNNFGNILKEWIYYEHDLKEEIAEICLFDSFLQEKEISLNNYLWTLPEWKEDFEWKTIYYINWKSKTEVLASPYLAQFKENNVDVLLLTKPIDEWILQVFTEFKKAKLKSVTSSDIKLKEETEEEKTKKEETKKEFKDLLELIKNTIWAEKIEKVELNDNLWNSLWALKSKEWWMTPQMEKMMKAMGQMIPEQKRILELNPKNSLVSAMKKEFESDLKSEKLKDLIKYSYNQAILLEWGELENIWEFLELTNKFAWNYAR